MTSPTVRGRLPQGERPWRVADLWFRWHSLQHHTEIVLVTIDGTNAGAFPRWVDNGERIAVHGKLLPAYGRVAWYLRVAAREMALCGFRVSVELRDELGHGGTSPLCDEIAVQPFKVHTIQHEIELPPRLCR